jgi:hypothetical protein
MLWRELFVAQKLEYNFVVVLWDQNAVQATIKELIWFEESAHLSIMVEPDKMTRELIRISREIVDKSK